MKARVKATNKIVDIYEQTLLTTFDSNDVRLDEVEFLEGDTNFTTDYWTRLEHQYAGMAMQGMLNNSLLTTGLLKAGKSHEDFVDEVTRTALRYAHALVEKIKEERE